MIVFLFLHENISCCFPGAKNCIPENLFVHRPQSVRLDGAKIRV